MSPMNPRMLRPIRKAVSGPSDPLFSQVVLLLHMDGVDASTTFTDSSSDNHTVVAHGDVQVDTADKKFGTGAALFDGDGDYLTVDFSQVPGFGVGGTPFTVEMWVYAPDGEGTDVLIARSGGVASWSDDDGLQFNLYFGGTDINCEFANNAGGNAGLTASGFTRDEWVHVAVCYDGTTTRLFLDGVQSATSSGAYGERSAANTLEIGRQQGWYDFSRYIDDLRITTGPTAARYTANFTPPTAAFPNQ